ncbi:putative tRNA-splicing endonuclease subunit tsp-2 [Podospora conica]|nr:putative tRNA-splicing endonuclease subunit tsp-2 [Schizothecium conicum]
MAETTTITAALANGAPPETTEQTVTALPATATQQRAAPASNRPRTPFHQIHALPVPIRTFPLPTFFPNNPISLVYLVLAWVRQVVSPPAAEPSTVHIGVWDPATGSVHVNDPKSIRVLWEQGFFGKGTLSRSEPNWMKRELGRRGASRAGNVSEERTEARREERRMAKWERAKTELEAIEQQRLEEARLHGALSAEVAEEHQPLDGTPVPEQVELPDEVQEVIEKPALHVAPASIPVAVSTFEGARPPTGPAELLALPNSLLDLPRNRSTSNFEDPKPPVGPAELLALPNSLADLPPKLIPAMELPQDDKPVLNQAPLDASLPAVNGLSNGVLANGHGSNETAKDEVVMTTEASASEPSMAQVNGIALNGFSSSLPSSESISVSTTQGNGPQPPKRRKSVRFSPEVESTTFQRHDPPSFSPDGLPKSTTVVVNGNANGSVSLPLQPSLEPTPNTAATTPVLEAAVNITEIPNKEQFQLAPEEAFFLVFALGVLSVVDPVTLAPIPTDKLLTLFRAQSHFPPQQPGLSLQPQDAFLINYAVYHHFRSLGWVPRHGIKFGVDWILYQRGPVFDHSEFGIMIMPSFSDKHWKETKFEAPRRSWSWLMGVNRVLSHVLKALVLVYVDVPSPAAFDEAMRQGGIAAALEKYTIREVMVRRFSVNRNR